MQTVTTCSGKNQFMTALVYKDVSEYSNQSAGGTSHYEITPRAIVVLSDLPVYSCHLQLLEIVYERVILEGIQATQKNMQKSSLERKLRKKNEVYSSEVQTKLKSFEFYISLMVKRLKVDNSGVRT
jgi:hypothetical protein